MSIEIGSKWRRIDASLSGQNELEIVGIHENQVWFKWDGVKQYDSFSETYLRDTFEEVIPFFVVDGMYRLKGVPSAKARWCVTDIRKVGGKPYAIALRVDSTGHTTLVVLDSLEYFEEV